MSVPKYPHRFRGFTRSPGFTLLELLIAVAVVGVLVAMALPSFREFNIRTQVTQLTNELVHDLTMARTEAVKRGRDVVVKANSSWSNGWSVKFGSERSARTPRLTPNTPFNPNPPAAGQTTRSHFRQPEACSVPPRSISMYAGRPREPTAANPGVSACSAAA
ncbi:MAG: GspH/FimT family pseudopilin [Xanthomonadales bacterium]|nr:GspH/FimT family pseudopilin [Xanthomonadales bacterium]